MCGSVVFVGTFTAWVVLFELLLPAGFFRVRPLFPACFFRFGPLLPVFFVRLELLLPTLLDLINYLFIRTFPY